jgi:hypothetical protein
VTAELKGHLSMENGVLVVVGLELRTFSVFFLWFFIRALRPLHELKLRFILASNKTEDL